MTGPALLQRITDIAEAAKFSAVAVSFYDYESARHFSHRDVQFFHAASTIKVPVLLALFKAAEEGRVRLDDTLHVRNRFHSLVNGEIFRVALGRDADGDVPRRIGRAMRVRELARAMIVRSSNLATNLLLDFLGHDEVRRFILDARLEGVKFQRGVEDNRAFERGWNNEISADGLVRCFRLLCEKGMFREETREAMLEILRAQEFNDMIPAKLPASATVAHKTGEISTVCHDAGVVFLPERKPYVLAILAEMPAGVDTRHGPVAEISRAIFEHLAPGCAGKKGAGKNG